MTPEVLAAARAAAAAAPEMSPTTAGRVAALLVGAITQPPTTEGT